MLNYLCNKFSFPNWIFFYANKIIILLCNP